MKVIKVRDITLDTDEAIMTATSSKSNEVVLLMSSGSVMRLDLDSQDGIYLFSVKSDIRYPDGGFDITARTSMYTMDEIVVVVNDFKRHGFVHYPHKYRALHLWRGDYHADISIYPIALYKNADGVPHLIFGEDWNHLQIMNLDTRQVLTASKSLIEENAEERYIEFYKEYPEDNKLPWPRPYNYFFGRLFISPNQHKFLSAGWIWGAYDSYHLYDIEEFISSNRISGLSIGAWERETRASCWVDNDTIAVVYNPFTEGDENSTVDAPCEIHFHKISGDKVEIDKKIQVTGGTILSSKMYFHRASNAFVILSDQEGLSVVSLDGEPVFKDKGFKANEYNVETGLFLQTDHKTISVYELVA